MSSFIIFAYVILEFRLIINIQININLHISLDHKILYLFGIKQFSYDILFSIIRN